MRTRGIGTRLVWGLLGSAWFFGTGLLHAQTDISNFRVPDVNDEGKMVSLLTGDKARMYPDKPMWIEGMVIEFYMEDGKTVEIRLTSPGCHYDTRANLAESEEAVKIEGAEFTVEGTGYRFDSNTSRMEILSDVRVVFNKVNLSASRKEEAPEAEPDSPTEVP